MLAPTDKFSTFLAEFEPKRKPSKEDLVLIESILKKEIKKEYLKVTRKSKKTD